MMEVLSERARERKASCGGYRENRARFSDYQRKNHRIYMVASEAGIQISKNTVSMIKRLVDLGADLWNPESVKEILAKQNDCKDSYKVLIVYAYENFLKMEDLTWQRPRYKQEEVLPFVPDEKELDQLIAACKSRRMAAFVQTLKETFADPGEALRLRWINISGNVITINEPVKGHLPGQIKVSNKLIAMLNALPRTSERIFPTNMTQSMNLK